MRPTVSEDQWGSQRVLGFVGACGFRNIWSTGVISFPIDSASGAAGSPAAGETADVPMSAPAPASAAVVAAVAGASRTALTASGAHLFYIPSISDAGIRTLSHQHILAIFVRLGWVQGGGGLGVSLGRRRGVVVASLAIIGAPLMFTWRLARHISVGPPRKATTCSAAENVMCDLRACVAYRLGD